MVNIILHTTTPTWHTALLLGAGSFPLCPCEVSSPLSSILMLPPPSRLSCAVSRCCCNFLQPLLHLAPQPFQEGPISHRCCSSSCPCRLCSCRAAESSTTKATPLPPTPYTDQISLTSSNFIKEVARECEHRSTLLLPQRDPCLFKPTQYVSSEPPQDLWISGIVNMY